MSFEDIILRGSQEFIPPKFKKFVIDKLHPTQQGVKLDKLHPAQQGVKLSLTMNRQAFVQRQGITAIKAHAHSYVWWPEIDSKMEARVKGCVVCQQNASEPSAKQVSWPVIRASM